MEKNNPQVGFLPGCKEIDSTRGRKDIVKGRLAAKTTIGCVKASGQVKAETVR